MTLAELLALLDDLAALTDEQLAEAIDALRTEADTRLDGDLSDEVLAELGQIADAIEAMSTEATARDEADEARREQAAALADRIRGEVRADDADDDGGEAADDAEVEPVTAEDEVEPAEAEDAEVEPEVVPVAAAATAPRIGRVAARRPAVVAPRAPAAPATMALTAAANVPGIQAGDRLDSPDRIAEAFSQVLRASAGYNGPRVQIPIMRAGSMMAADVFDDARILGPDARENRRKINAVTSPEAITASGGICAPIPVRYDFPVIGTDARPVRDSAMTTFGVDRGGIRLLPPVTLTQVAGAVDVWTEANDRTPASPTTKPCLVMSCPEDEETVVEAITKCLEVGNFRARFFAEQVDEWLRMAGVQHARVAETELLEAIADGSTHVTSATVLGASRDILTTLDRAWAGFVSRHRGDPNAQRLRWAAPFWVKNMIRTDLAREAPGSSDERLAVADATIDSFFAVRNISPSWFLDGESGQVFGAQGTESLLGWPSTLITYLYPEGSWLFLDGGSLDFGIVRDNTKNATNDFRIFSETFEAGAFHGVESLRIVMDVCPDGATSESVSIDPCTSGS